MNLSKGCGCGEGWLLRMGGLWERVIMGCCWGDLIWGRDEGWRILIWCGGVK